VLAAADELGLTWLCQDAAAAGLHLAAFHEPDLGGPLTAAALEPPDAGSSPACRSRWRRTLRSPK
jgi:hypothetical protein